MIDLFYNTLYLLSIRMEPELSEFVEEFTCPITYVIMEDPVIIA